MRPYFRNPGYFFFQLSAIVFLTATLSVENGLWANTTFFDKRKPNLSVRKIHDNEEKTFHMPLCTTQTLTLQITSDDDDAEEDLSSNSVSLGSSDLELGADGSSDQVVGLRFNNMNIEQGATINSAYVQFETDETNSGACSVIFWGEDVDNALGFTSSDGDISNRPKTTNLVAWSNTPAWNTVNEKHDSPDLTSIVQEIVNRPGWVTGNSLVIFIEGTGQRTAEAHDGEPVAAPVLVISYEDCTLSSTAEICGNGIDDDGDGLTDSADPDCPSASPCMVTGDVCTYLQNFVSPDEANNTTYRSNWLAAVGETPDNLIDFESMSNGQNINGAAISTQGLTLTNLDGGYLVVSDDISGTSPIGALAAEIDKSNGPAPGGSNGDDVAITFSTGANVNYLGFYLLDYQEHSGAFQSYARLVLDDGTQCDIPFDYTEADCCPEFVGFVAPTGFYIDSLILLTGSGSVFGIDDIEYGTIASSCPEICDNGIDDDGDGIIDCNDPDCNSSLSITVNATAPNICIGENTTLSVTVLGGSAPYTYTWGNGLGAGISHNINPATTTNYTVTVTSNGGCTSTAQGTVTVNFCAEDCTDGIDNDGDGLVDCNDPDCGLNLSATPTDASCGNNDGQVSITITGGTGNFEYSDDNLSWHAGNTFSGLAPGNYTLYAQNTNGTCQASVGAAVGEACEDCTDGVDNDGDGLIDCADPDCAPLASAGADFTICNGDNTTITATASRGSTPYSFTWDNGLGNGASHTVAPTNTTIYTVSVSSPSGCVSTAQVTVTATNCSEICTDGIDNDSDGLVDCNDPDCQAVGMPVLVDDVFNSCPGVDYGNVVSMNDGNLQDPAFSILTPPTNGTVSINNLGAFTFSPTNSNCGVEQFTYQVCNQTTGCCATANATINLGDSNPPTLQNVPTDITISCDDEIPIPPVVLSIDDCPGIYMEMEETNTLAGMGNCANYTITRTWTTTDLCGNSASQSQQITVADNTAPELFRVHALPNGMQMVAGEAQQTSHHWKYVKFPIHFSAPPLVFAQVISENDNAAVAVQTRYISTTGFEIRLVEEEAADGQHLGETVSWVAMEAGVWNGGNQLEAGLITSVNHNVQVLNFTTAFATEPVFISTVQGHSDADPFSVHTLSEATSGIQLLLQEEESADAETIHPNEQLAYLALTSNVDLYSSNGLFMGQTGRLNADHNWVTVALGRNYNKPVILFGGLTDVGNQGATIRVRNVTQNSFEVRVQEWDYMDGVHSTESLDYVVIEGGLPMEQNFLCSENADLLQPGVDIIAMDNCDQQIAFDFAENETQLPFGKEIRLIWTAVDDCGNLILQTQWDTCRVAAFQLKTLLSGAKRNNVDTDLMRDDLRTKGYIPSAEPYSDLGGFSHRGLGGNGNIKNSTILEMDGARAVTDWIFVECRDANNVEKVLSTRSLLLRSDGTVTTTENENEIYFWDLPEGNYYLSVRHRNHLALVTDHPWLLSSENPPMINLANPSTLVSGGQNSYQFQNGQRLLWGGDFSGDGRVIYQGPNNDVLHLFTRVLTDEDNKDYLANYIVSGYVREDFDLNGQAIYQGPGNDRAMLLYNTVLVHQNNISFLANFIVSESLP